MKGEAERLMERKLCAGCGAQRAQRHAALVAEGGQASASHWRQRNLAARA